jgi:YVTN family beta-propeller protein
VTFGVRLWRVLLPFSVALVLQSGSATAAAQHYVAEGIAVDVESELLGRAPTGLDMRLSVRLSDATAGTALAAVNPAAWLTLNRRGKPLTEQICRRQVAAYLSGNPFVRPDIDLTGFTLVAMNRDASVTVLDPQGSFGGSRMLAMLPLDSPGIDWAVEHSPPRLFVSERTASRLAVIDTERWQQTASIALPQPPGSVLLQHDGRYLWAAAWRDGGVAAVATDTLSIAAHIPIGKGAHRLAITSDDKRMFVTNQESGSVSVIDPQQLTAVTTIPVGVEARAIAISNLAHLAYVAVTDSIAVIDPGHDKLARRIDGVVDVTEIAISPDGRWGFAISPARNQLSIFDTTTNRLVQTTTVDDGPYEVAFTDTEAYVRRHGSEAVTLVPLAPLSDGRPVGPGEFPAGEKPSSASPDDTLAPSMVASPGEPAMLLASPDEHGIHYYREGMAAPTQSFDDLGRQPVAVAVVDRSLHQITRGTYSAVARMPRPGVYDLAVLLDSPRVAHCFELDVDAGPDSHSAAVTLEPVAPPRTVPVGRPVALQFRQAGAVVQPAANRPTGTALVVLSPGSWFDRIAMTPAGDGTWALRFTPPQAGTYLIAFDVPALGLSFDTGPHFAIEAVAQAAGQPKHE